LTAALTVHWPEGQGQATVQPNDRDRYVITQTDTGQFSLQKE
jgi:hypothetical protein